MKVIVLGDNHSWGRADTLTQAFKNAYSPKHYVAFLCSDETEVSGFDGALSYPLDGPEPVKIDEKLPKAAKPAKLPKGGAVRANG